jgi:hypothetical protein
LHGSTASELPLGLLPRTLPGMSKRPALSLQRVQDFIEALFKDDLHAKRVRSLSDATIGVLHAGALGVHAIGRGLAAARGRTDKHAIKQVDRMFSNAGIDPWELFRAWVPHVVGDRKEIFVNFDWTEFEPDDHSMIVASLQTNHGRTTPLMWLTVTRSELKNQRNNHEDELLSHLQTVMPAGVKVTIVADRGFADHKLYAFMATLGFDYIIRFRSIIHVTTKEGETKSAKDWLGTSGRMRVFREASITTQHHAVSTVLCVQAEAMADAWCIATSRSDLSGPEIVAKYGKRFSIEEMFRDVKDLRFGMGLGWRTVGDTKRRDRIFLIAALAMDLLTLLGQAGEAAGIDRVLKTNTSKKRTLSLFRQGLLWYERIPTMPEERLRTLMHHFGSLILDHRIYRLSLGME